MNIDINQQLSQAQEQKRRKERLQSRLLDAHKQLARERDLLRELDGRLKAEERDVDRLSRLSLWELFYTVLGSKEEQLEKERQEALAARLEYTKAKYSVDSLTREIEDLQREIEGLSDVEALIARLLSEREAAILQTGGPEANRLMEISNQIQSARRQQKEVQEAISAGTMALQGLESVAQSLGSAENWGVWDMLGGGLLATAAKHSRIDEARDQAMEVQQMLRRFQRELADVQVDRDELVIDLSGFERFADFFFDGLITDWIVQSKIQDSLKNVQSLHERVSHILADLKTRLSELERDIARLESDRQALAVEFKL